LGSANVKAVLGIIGPWLFDLPACQCRDEASRALGDASGALRMATRRLPVVFLRADRATGCRLE